LKAGPLKEGGEIFFEGRIVGSSNDLMMSVGETGLGSLSVAAPDLGLCPLESLAGIFWLEMPFGS
jgi:hypothetical protein